MSSWDSLEALNSIGQACANKEPAAFALSISITKPSFRLLADIGDDEKTVTDIVNLSIAFKPVRSIAIAHWKVAYEISRNKDLIGAAEAQNSLLIQLNRFAEKNSRWILPSLSTVAKELRQLAILADKSSQNSEKRHLENATRTINRSFQICLNDREPKLEESRKWGIYFFMGELFKIYFMLHKQSLCKNLLRAVDSVEHPPVDEYPASHNVTVAFYVGVIYFIEEKYAESHAHLMKAMSLCYKTASNNQQKILLYLIPVTALRPLWDTASTSRSPNLPSRQLLDKYPLLKALYKPLLQALNDGDVNAYNKLLTILRPLLVKKYLYLAFQRMQLLVSRNLLYTTYKILNEPTRISVAEFANALTFAKYYPYEPSDEEDRFNQTEGLVSALIASNLIKGYISHEKRMIVLSAKNAFPYP